MTSGHFRQISDIAVGRYSATSAHVSEIPQIPTLSMFNFISSSRIRVSISNRCYLSINDLHSLLLPSSPPSVSVSVNSSSEHSFGVSYLIKTFGWTPEIAISKAKYLKFKNPDEPDRVLVFLKNHGFDETQILTTVKKDPLFLLSDPKNTLLVKFRFLSSLGLSRTEITRVVTQAPGLLRNSLERRISDDEAVEMVSSEKPERVLEFLKKNGFTRNQISHLVKKFPQLLLCDHEATLLPKFEFLSCLGLSRTEVNGVVTKEPKILKRSLEKRIIPAFNHIRELVKSDIEAVKMVKRYPAILHHNLAVNNIQILREVGVPEENIAASMVYQRRGHTPAPDIYRKLVEEVKDMGFDPCSLKFISALRTIRSMSKSTWEDKVQVLKNYGRSDREILLAFVNCPKFISSSKDKIEGVMDFLVNRMGIEATAIAKWPNIISMNLEKRVVPRCLVYQYVLEKGLRKRKLSIYTLCSFSENQFITRVIKPYVNEAPGLLDLYKELFDIGNDLEI